MPSLSQLNPDTSIVKFNERVTEYVYYYKMHLSFDLPDQKKDQSHPRCDLEVEARIQRTGSESVTISHIDHYC